MPGKKILMLVGEFSEEYEIFVFEQGMQAIGHTVHVVCPDKKAGDVIIIPAGLYHGFSEVPDHIEYVLVRPDVEKVLPAGYVSPLLKK